MLGLEELLQVPHVEPYSGYDLSPDGTRIAFSWNLTGRWEIYRLPLDSSEAAQPLTSGPGSKFAPRWSPDGGRLAYLVDLDGGEQYDLYLLDLSTGAHSNLTPDTANSIQPSLSWSPDGRRIAFISDRGGRFGTYVVDVDDGVALPLTSLPYPESQVSWSPDGRWLAVTAETRGQEWGTFLVPAEGGGARPIGEGGVPLSAKDACWSPDSARIAFSSDLHGRWDVGVYQLGTGRVFWLTGGEADNEVPVWSPDGRRLAYVASQGPVTWIAVSDLDRRPPATHRVAPGVHYGPRFTPDGARLTFVFDDPAHPPDLWLLWLADGSPRQLTQSLPPGLAGASFVNPAQVHYPSLDAVSVPALLYRHDSPAGLPPAIVLVHGGPDWLAQVTWDPLVQHVVSRGWVVLAPNYRGSTGYGRGWQYASRFDYGGVDTMDVVAGADYLARQGLADPKRIAVTGRSWGGYLTMTALTGYSDRWVAGSAVVPFLNWFTSHANVRPDLRHWDRENFGDPEADRERWYQRSPFFFLDQVRSPVQLICGAHDPRCPPDESIQAYERLVAQGKVCDLILYPDEGHTFLQTHNLVDSQLRRVAFLAQAVERTDRKPTGECKDGASHCANS